MMVVASEAMYEREYKRSRHEMSTGGTQGLNNGRRRMNFRSIEKSWRITSASFEHCDAYRSLVARMCKTIFVVTIMGLLFSTHGTPLACNTSQPPSLATCS